MNALKYKRTQKGIGMDMKKRWKIAAALLLCLGILTGCTGNTGGEDDSAKGIKMYLTVSSADTFRQTLIDTAEKTATEMGAEFAANDAEGSLEKQLAQIKEAVDGGYDVILCNPVDVDTALQLKVAAGDLPIVFYNSCPDDEYLEADKYIFVGSNEADAGKFQSEYILEQFAGQDSINVAIFEGEKLHSATLGRTSALKAALKDSGKKIHYVFDDYADWDTEIAKQRFEVLLKTGQKVDVAACNNDGMALGIIQACEEKGISFNDIKIIGIDATADGCQAIENDKMAFTVYQSATGQGSYAVKAAARLAQGKSLDGMKYLSKNKKYVWVPFEKVDKSNVQKYK